MSIDSIDVRALTTALLSVPKRARFQAELPKLGLFDLVLILPTSYILWKDRQVSAYYAEILDS